MQETDSFRRRLAGSVAALWCSLSVASYGAFEGFGAVTSGGNDRGTVRVTSLDDSGSGTLRAALEGGGSRRIVFQVSGTIVLQNALKIQDVAFITVDGSTAPPPGITLQGAPLVIDDAHDIIITHLRIRDSRGDGIRLRESRNVVIDHCSISNAADENIGITEDVRNVTVSWCMIGDTRAESFELKSKGMLIANFFEPPVSHVTLHHNLFVNQSQRSPQVSTAGLFDVRNNVVLGWSAYGMRMRNGARGNIVNNVLESESNPKRALVLPDNAGPVYVAGNRGPGSQDLDRVRTADKPFEVAPVTTDPTARVREKVLEGAGAFPRDSIDDRLIRIGASK